ncbi:50S ribosomal protein L35 [Desulfohalovibrio reitneri]|uniref:50S ribosomal protein L35 n=1 Tax=Desulfohalovibrio reitneri TaxID=1307759 RepID=UPI0004A6B713|nr:50S ribosomal protein L35 [Desulfohalovibrio reitneri]
MPKIKTNRAAAKRFKKTGSGKFMRRQRNMRHILTKMSSKRQRRLNGEVVLDGDDVKRVKRMCPYL